MKALVDRIIQYAGQEYRLKAGQQAPVMPDGLVEILAGVGYVEKPPEPKVVKPASKERKEE